MMNEKDIRYELMCRAINTIRDAAFEWLNPDESGYKEAINYIQGVLEMLNAIDKVLNA